MPGASSNQTAVKEDCSSIQTYLQDLTSYQSHKGNNGSYPPLQKPSNTHNPTWPTEWLYQNRMHFSRHDTIVSNRDNWKGTMKASIRSSTPPKALGPAANGRRNCSPCRKLQQSPQARRCPTGQKQSQDFLADKAEWKRTLHDTTYRTYKALPRSNRSFGLQDFALLREIFALAENLTQMDGTEVRLTDVLRAYDIVLQRHGMDPAEDTFYYRMLLKLSLRSEKDWWNRLNKEILKNDILMKVTSFRNHKLLLCYWLQWRCHHEKGVLRDRCLRTGHFMRNENNISYMELGSQNETPCSDIFKLSSLQTKKTMDGHEVIMSLPQMPFHPGTFPIKMSDALLPVDLVELPVLEDKDRNTNFDMKRLALLFRAWQRVIRQAKKTRCTREKNIQQWKLAVHFNEKTALVQSWELWRCLCASKMNQAIVWHQNLLLQKCVCVWSSYCALMRELCKAGENLYRNRLCLSIFTEWRDHTCYMIGLSKNFYKDQAFRAWKMTNTLHKHAVQVMDQRKLSCIRYCLHIWRTRQVDIKQQKAVLSQCQKIHWIHVMSACMQDWHTYACMNAKYRALECSSKERRIKHVKILVLQQWKAWTHQRHLLKHINLFGAAWHNHFLQRETFKSWMTLWNRKQTWKKFQETIVSLQRRRYFCVWRSWRNKRIEARLLLTSIMRHMMGHQCRRVFLQWKDWSKVTKLEKKKLRGIERHRRVQKKVRYWQEWCQQFGYESVVTQFRVLQGRKIAAMALRALYSLAEASHKSRKKLEDTVVFEQIEKNRSRKYTIQNISSLPPSSLLNKFNLGLVGRNRWKVIMQKEVKAMKAAIRKWKYFVEMRRTHGFKKDLVLKFWTKFWLKTALEGWKIRFQKGRCKRWKLQSAQQEWHTERMVWAPRKQKMLHGMSTKEEKEESAFKWRNFLLMKSALLSWKHFSVIKQEQVQEELWRLLQLKRWWISSMLSHWRALAQKYAKEKRTIHGNEQMIPDQLTSNEFLSKGANEIKRLHSFISIGRKNCSDVAYIQIAWSILMANAKVDPKTKKVVLEIKQHRLRVLFKFLMLYIQHRIRGKLTQRRHKENCLRGTLCKWRRSTSLAQQEKPKIIMINEHLQKFPKRYKLIEIMLSTWPRWAICRGFQIWREWSKGQILKRKFNRKALEHLARKLHVKTFASFQKTLADAQTVRNSIRHANVQAQVKVLLTWKCFCKDQMENTKLKTLAALHYRNKAWNIVFMSWQSYLKLAQKASLANSKSVSFWRLLTLGKCFKAWVEVFFGYKAKLQYFTWIKIRMDFHCLHNVLCAWRYLIHQKITQRSQVYYFQQQRRLACLHKRFHIWVCYIHKRKWLRAAQEMHRRRHLKSYLHAWISGIMRLKTRKRAEDVVMSHLFRKFGRTAFLGWQDVTAMARHVRKNHAIATNKFRHYRILSAFTKWREVVASINFISNLVNSFLPERKRKIFENWTNIVKWQQKLRQDYSIILSMKKQCCIRKKFQTWKERTSRQKKGKEGAYKSALHRRRSVLAAVFDRLKGWMHDRQMKAGFSLLACGKLQHVSMKWAFKSWLAHASISSKRRAGLHQLQQAQKRHLLSKTFSATRNLTEENWLLRRMILDAFMENHESIKMAKAESWHQKYHATSLLQGWWAGTRYYITLRKREQIFKFHILRRATHKWRSHSTCKREANTLGRQLAIHHCRFLARRYWLCWQVHAEEARYQQQFLLFKTFRAWMKYAKWKALWRSMEQDAVVMILQSLQKRVIWSWHSLVREIAVRREEHQQQRFLQREAMVLATRTERRQKTELLSSVFTAWKSTWQLSMAAASIIIKTNNHLKQEVWSAWLLLAAQSAQAKKLRHQWLQSILHHSFNAWREASYERIEDSRGREAQAGKFAAWKCKKTAWLQWTSYVNFCKDRVKVLQDCFSLIEVGHLWDTIREMVYAWKNYTSERGKKREHSWAAEASYKRHKLADYLTAWHHYTVASKDSASSLRGSIQVYKQRGSNAVRPVGRSKYNFGQSFAHIPRYGNGERDFHEIHTPSVVIEEVHPHVEEIEGRPSFFLPSISTPHPQILLESPETKPTDTSKVSISNASLLENGTMWGQASANEHFNFDTEEDTDTWFLNDNEITLIR